MWTNSVTNQTNPSGARIRSVYRHVALPGAVLVLMLMFLSACGGGGSSSAGSKATPTPTSPPGTLVTPQPQNTPIPTAVGVDDYRVRMLWGNYDARVKEISASLMDWAGSVTRSDTSGIVNAEQTILFDLATGDKCNNCKPNTPTYYVTWQSTTRAFQDGIHVQLQTPGPTDPALKLTYESTAFSTGFPAGVDFSLSLFDSLNTFIPMAGDPSKGLLVTGIYTSAHPSQGFVQGYFFPSGATCPNGDSGLTLAGLLFDRDGFGTHYISGNNICLDAGNPVAFAGKVTDLNNNFVGNLSAVLTFDSGLTSGKVDGTWVDHDGVQVGELHAIYPMLIAPAGGYFMGYIDAP